MEEAKWYVAHTFSGYENKVASNIQTVVENRNLHDLIQEVAIPTETVVEVKDDGTKKEYQRKLMPGYVFVKMVMTDDSWYVVRNTRGCTGFVGPEGEPQPLTDEEKQAILQLRIEHINKLKAALNKDSILIDCHSFIAEEDDRWIDVCIGFNDDWSYNKKVVDIVYKTFKKHGYEVSLNKPYANSIAPKMDFEYPSVMIEVNKALYYNYYLNILNTDPKVWMRWYYCLGEVYQNLKSI